MDNNNSKVSPVGIGILVFAAVIVAVLVVYWFYNFI